MGGRKGYRLRRRLEDRGLGLGLRRVAEETLMMTTMAMERMSFLSFFLSTPRILSTRIGFFNYSETIWNQFPSEDCYSRFYLWGWKHFSLLFVTVIVLWGKFLGWKGFSEKK